MATATLQMHAVAWLFVARDIFWSRESEQIYRTILPTQTRRHREWGSAFNHDFYTYRTSRIQTPIGIKAMPWVQIAAPMTTQRQEEGRLCASVYGMICHPLLAKLDASSREWRCRAIPPENMRHYNTIRCPVLLNPSCETSIMELLRLKQTSHTQLIQWITRKGMALEQAPCGIVDTATGNVYPIELIVSRHAKACLVSILYTQKRITRNLASAAVAHAAKIHAICVNQYAMQVTTLIINVFFTTDAQGHQTVGVTGISRPLQQGAGRRAGYHHQSSSESTGTIRRRLPTNDAQANASSSSAISELVVGGGGTGTTTGSVT